MSPAQVRLYTRRGCHLCEDVEADLERLQAVWPHALERVEVDTEPVLARRYGNVIPVVVVDDRWVMAARVDRALLTEALALAQRARAGRAGA